MRESGWIELLAWLVRMNRTERQEGTEGSPAGYRNQGMRSDLVGGLSDDALERTGHVQQAHAALAGLAPAHRAVLVLREMEGLCYERIAEVLDLPVGKVRTRLHRARLQLRGKMTQPAAERAT